ncbi:MAG TPA: PIN domain-containing protein [Haliangium sp.]|nr:PIN domain-containing protein [Haliangium sp.]
MRLWVLDTNLVVDLLEGDPARKAPLMRLAEQAMESGAFLAVSAVTVQEYLVLPRAYGEDAYHRCRLALNRFLVLQFDRAAAEAAAKLELAKYRQAYLDAGAASRTEAKRWWFRDAAVVGAAVAAGAEYVFTREGPMVNMQVAGVQIRQV